MPEWAYVITGFVLLTVGYLAGFLAAMWKAEQAPTENAWINVRKFSIQANTEVQKCAIEAEHEERMAMIERGVFAVGEDGAEEEEST